MEEEKAMDDEWNDNAWADDVQMSENEGLMAEVHDLEAEKLRLNAQIAELEASISYQN